MNPNTNGFRTWVDKSWNGNHLKVMDSTAISLAKESKIPIIITNITRKNSIIDALNGIGKFSKIN